MAGMLAGLSPAYRHDQMPIGHNHGESVSQQMVNPSDLICFPSTAIKEPQPIKSGEENEETVEV
jgi:hypothetical protein